MKKINMKEVKSFALMILLVFSFRSMCFEPFRIPSGSMIPTLNIGDFIVVSKFSYGWKVPFSDMFSDPIYFTGFEAPKRNDVIVFKYPEDPSLNYIKRVVGLPGDEIEVLNKEVFVNGQRVASVPEDGVMTKDFADSFSGEKVHFYKVKNDEHDYVFQTTFKQTRLDNVPRFKVPEGKFFVMGDNRDFSADSRVWGFVPKENIKGKAQVVWMSFTFPGTETELSFSPSRIGKLIF